MKSSMSKGALGARGNPMRLTCPLCGPRDRREFYYSGTEDYLNRPPEGAPIEAWDDMLHLRTNPAG
eukprot:gene60930-81241_t